MLDNPYLDIWTWHNEKVEDGISNWQSTGKFRFDGEMGAIAARHTCVDTFGFAIPNDEVIELIAAQSTTEVGAGSGYWASLVDQAGGDIKAVDLRPPGSKKGWFTKAPQWYPVEQDEALYAAQEAAMDGRALLTTWPSYGDNWMYQATYAYWKAGGTTLFYVGEGIGGCTANDRFFDFVERKFELNQIIDIPQWFGVHDVFYVYETN